MTYLIIGAGGGIGQALTARLAARGAALALVGRTAEPLAALAAATPGARTYTADARDLNYDKYFVEGEADISQIEDYTSHNTKRLSVDEVKQILLGLEIIRNALPK